MIVDPETELVVCHDCGALVGFASQKKHSDWHEGYRDTIDRHDARLSDLVDALNARTDPEPRIEPF